MLNDSVLMVPYYEVNVGKFPYKNPPRYTRIVEPIKNLYFFFERSYNIIIYYDIVTGTYLYTAADHPPESSSPTAEEKNPSALYNYCMSLGS